MNNEYVLLYNCPIEDDELMHFGVKGMHWGIRKDPYSGYNRIARPGSHKVASNMKGGAKRLYASTSGTPEDIARDVLAVNGGKKGFDYGYNRDHNCAFCSAAYEMRRRGQDVQAQRSLEGVSNEAARGIVMNLSKKDIHEEAHRDGQSKSIGMTKDEFNEMRDTILKDGENSRGQMTVRWKGPEGYSSFAGGHALNYEVKDGTFYLVDSQVGQVLKDKKAYDYLKNACNVTHYRTDNKKISNVKAAKYYTEKYGDKKINNAARIANGANAVAGVGLATASISLRMGPEVPAAVVGFGLGATVGLAGSTVGAVVGAKAKKNREREALKLQNTWNKDPSVRNSIRKEAMAINGYEKVDS